MSSGRCAWFVVSISLFASGSALAQSAPSPAPAPAAAAPEISGQPIDAESAVRRALQQSPVMKSAALDVEQAKQGVIAEEGRYPYVFQADVGHTRSASPRIGPGDSVSTSYSRSYTAGAALRRTFPFGTTAEVRVEGERFESEIGSTDIGSTRIGSGYGATARATVNHPLLRGSGRDVGELELRTARQARTLSEQARARAVSETARDVLLAYWELWYADEAVRIERSALELARQQEREAREQQAQGALAPADVYTFSTRVAQLEETMVSALIQRQQRSLELTRLMGGSPDGAPQLVASDTPTPGPMPSAKQIEAALRESSVELAELRAQVELARTRAEVAGEASRPRLDVEGWVQTYGESERVLRAAERAGQMRWVSVHVGAVFELPLDDSRRQAEKRSALLAVQIAEQNLRAARDRLAAEAIMTVAEARAAEERLALSEKTVAVSEQAFEAARARFELGGAIAIQVQQAEEEVRRARLRLARARVDLVQSQIIAAHLAGELVAKYDKS